VELNAKPSGANNWACVAGPSSPPNPAVPVPATVEILPSGDTFRTTDHRTSEKNKLPAGSRTRPIGIPMEAKVAGPPSPLQPFFPFPAIVLILPSGSTRRIRVEPSAR